MGSVHANSNAADEDWVSNGERSVAVGLQHGQREVVALRFEVADEVDDQADQERAGRADKVDGYLDVAPLCRSALRCLERHGLRAGGGAAAAAQPVHA